MKVRIPAKEVEACDICERLVGTGLLTKCVVCGKEYCHICEGILMGCIHPPEICKLCAGNKTIAEVVNRFTVELSRVLGCRDRAMKLAAAKKK